MIHESIGAIRMPHPTADLGEAAKLLVPELAAQYLVDADYEDEIVKLIEARPERRVLLARLSRSLRSLFGDDARLMLAALSSLDEPSGPALNLVIYTWLDELAAAEAVAKLRAQWLGEVTTAGLEIGVTRMFKTTAGG